MTLTLDEITPGVTALHQRAETAFARDGRVLGTIGLILPDARIGAVLPFGPDGKPPSNAFIQQSAAARGAVGLAQTGEYWVNPDPITRRQAARAAQDLPLPSSLDPARRGEQILTTAVLRGHDLVLRVITLVVRGTFGTGLGERVVEHDDPAMPSGEARYLLALLDAAAR